MDAGLEDRDLSAYELSADAMVHLCRHLALVDESWLASAQGRGIDSAAARAETGRAGSRFFPAFASDPETLFDRFRSAILSSDVRPVFRDGTCVAVVRFPREAWPEGIGENALAAVGELTEAEAGSLVPEVRGEHMVNVCVRDSLPPTWQGVCVFGNAGGALGLLTVFPGSYAPPLAAPDGAPDPFWAGHVLIRKKDKAIN